MINVVVLDVNILASAAAVPGSVPAYLVDEAFSGRFTNVVSERMLMKLDDVLLRPYFAERLSLQRREAVIRRTRELSILRQPDPTVRGIAEDDEDDAVLGTAVAAQADYLVTGDHGLLEVGSYRGVTIITARAFLAVLDSL